MPRAIWVDTDIALGARSGDVDDAFALAAVVRSPALRLVGVSSVFGNTSSATAARCAERLLAVAGSNVPVVEGAARAGGSSAAAEAIARLPAGTWLLALGPLTNVAAALARRTTCKIAILGNAFGLRDHPLTLAEEHAMIDVLTGGRLISGMVRGIGAEYFSFGANPAFSHARFQEAHDLVVHMWTRPGPFAFEGKYYKFKYVNPWPRPYQEPHPPIFIPSSGSLSTIKWAAEHRYTYCQTLAPIAAVARTFQLYREAAEQAGYQASPDQLAWSNAIYVADTDEKALREAKRNTNWVDQNAAWESAVLGFCRALYSHEAFLAEFEPFVARLTRLGEAVALRTVALKLTSPGVPDIYQGDEMPLRALVDPDNRRPVDWQLRRERLDGVAAGDPPDAQTLKLWLIWTLLELRRRRPEAFVGSYEPVAAGDRVVAFVRGAAVLVAVATRPEVAVEAAAADGDWNKVLGGDEHGFAVWERPDR